MRRFEVLKPSRAFYHLVVVAVLAISLIGAVADTAQANGEKLWTIVETVGSAEVKSPDGASAPASKGARVVAGSAIVTGATGRVTLKSAGDIVTITAKSRIQFPARRPGSQAPSVKQTLGTALFNIFKRQGKVDRFRVSTPYLAAVIKGTTFSVTVNNEGAALHVSTGAVEVRSLATNRVVMVRPGMTATASSKSGVRMKLSGGGTRKQSGDAATGRKDGAGDQASGSKSAPGQAKAAKGPLAKGVGAKRLDVFSATKGMVDNFDRPNSNVGVPRRSNAASAKTGPGVPKSVKQALSSAARGAAAGAKASGRGNGNAYGRNKNRGKSKRKIK